MVYLNGVEIFRSNMPSGSIIANTRASESVGGFDENAVYSQTFPLSRYAEGENVLAVEVHQSSSTSSDVGFDLQASISINVYDRNILHSQRHDDIAYLMIDEPVEILLYDLVAAETRFSIGEKSDFTEVAESGGSPFGSMPSV